MALLNVDFLSSNVSKSISPSLSDDSMTSFDSAYASEYSFMVKDETILDYDSLTSSQESMVSTHEEKPSSGGELSKVNLRRLKNRESAARSRQKIKTKLSDMEMKICRLEAKAAALKNEKSLLLGEIESMENQMIDFSLEKIKSKLSIQPISELELEKIIRKASSKEAIAAK